MLVTIFQPQNILITYSSLQRSIKPNLFFLLLWQQIKNLSALTFNYLSIIYRRKKDFAVFGYSRKINKHSKNEKDLKIIILVLIIQINPGQLPKQKTRIRSLIKKKQRLKEAKLVVSFQWRTGLLKFY